MNFRGVFGNRPPFVAVDCVDRLCLHSIESELFGYEKGVPAQAL